MVNAIDALVVNRSSARMTQSPGSRPFEAASIMMMGDSMSSAIGNTTPPNAASMISGSLRRLTTPEIAGSSIP